MTPDGWQKRKIREFSERLKRINSDGLDLEPLSITKDRGVILQSEKYSKRIATDPRKYVFAEDGDFAFDPMSLYYGAIGRVGGIGRGLVSPDYVVFSADRTVDSNFLLALLRYPEMHKLYESLSETGNTFGKRRRLYWSIFEDIELLLPPVTEQRKIAAILSSLDQSIEATQAVIDQLQVLKQAMLAELLTRGLPGRHSGFKRTEIGEVPEEWEVRRLEEWLTRLIDYRGKSPPKHHEGTCLLTAKNVRVGYIDREPREYIRDDAFGEWMSRGVPEPGDVLFTTEAPLGNAASVPADRIALGQRLVTLCPDRTRVDPLFLLWTVLSPGFQALLQSKATGSTVQGIKQSVLRTLPVAMPSVEEQRIIGKTVEGTEACVATTKKELDALRFLKKALMSVLLTGDVRVKPDEEVS